MAEPERTDDGRYIVVDGRRWRASDPSIPDALRQELVNALMHARRRVRTLGDAARPWVNDAKTALGERGDPWWEPTEEGRRDRLAATMRTLLRGRGGSTICPSDAARVVGGDDWRDLMEAAREVARLEQGEGRLVILQKGEPVGEGPVKGPIRLGRGPRLASWDD